MTTKEPDKLKEKQTSLKEVSDQERQNDDSAAGSTTPDSAAGSDASDSAASNSATSSTASTTEAQPDQSEPAADDPRPELDECYEILAVVGKGGMGSVYKVYQKGIDKILAIKILQPSLTSDLVALKRFEQEVDSASKLSHSNLAAVYGHGKTKNGAPYLVMDYLDGESLSSFLKRIGTLDPKRALAIFTQIASALAHAHENSVIHRDIKPTNIIITSTTNGAEKAHIVDFGIAKVMPTANRETHDLTETGEVFGSPHYMSPEQCLGFMLDERSDIYSLGCLMYEVLTGEPPFGGANPIQVVVKHINEEAPPFPDELKSDTVRSRLEDVVVKCLEKDKSQRYQSVNDLIKDLNLIAAGKAPPRHVRQREPKKELTRRGTIGLVVGGVIALVYILMLTGMSGNVVLIGQMLVWVVTFLLACGAYSFIMAVLEKIRKIRAGKNSENEWWQALLMGSLASTCLTIYPTAFATAIALSLQWRGSTPEWVGVVIGHSIIAHGISVAIAAVAAIGCLIFRKKARGTLPRIGVEFVALSATLFVTAFYVVPDGTALVLKYISKGVSQISKPISSGLGQLAAYVEKDNTDAALLYTEQLIEDKKFDEAINVLSHAIQRAEKPDSRAELLSRRAQIYAENLKDIAKFYTDVGAAIAANGAVEAYKLRADQLAKEGKYRQAIADLSSSITTNNNIETVLSRAKLWMAVGEFQKTIADADQYINDEAASEPTIALLLRAKAYQLRGDKNLAEADYKLITQLTKSLGSDRVSNLLLAYAYNQLGNVVQSEKYLGLAKEVDEQTRDMLNEHLEVPDEVNNLFTWRILR